jgi:peptide/nickel transport system substrate-binding protein
MQRLMLSVLVLVLVLGVGGTVFAQDAQAGGKLTVGIQYEPVTLDPHVTGQANARRMLHNIVDTLVYADAQGELHPWLAESWDISEDGLVYTFYLRQGVTFHDGTPFNAEAMKFTWDRIMDPATASASAIAEMGPFERAEVLDEFTIRAYLSRPSALWLRSMSSAAVAPVSPAAVEALGDRFGRAPVATGAFKIVEWADNQSLTVVRHEDYDWAPAVFEHSGPAYLDEIEFIFIPEAQVRLGTVETGETDIIEEVPPRFVDMIDRSPDFNLISTPYSGSPLHYMINVNEPPTDDVAVRRAVLHSVDSESIVASLYAGVVTPGNGPMSANTLGSVPGIYRDFYPFDPEAAAAILDEAGWVLGNDGVRVKDGNRLQIVINVLTDVPEYAELGQVLQSQLGEVGMEVVLKPLARSPWAASNSEGDFNMVGMGLWRNDPHMLSLLWRTDGSAFTWSHYSNPEFDAIVDEASQLTDLGRRLELYHEAQEILMRDAVSLPIYDQMNIMAANLSVQGIIFDQSAFPFYHATYLQR